MTDYDIDIEIDADTGDIIWTNTRYGSQDVHHYTVEELEGKGEIDNALQGGAQITVYSQGQTYTLEEWIEITRGE